MTKRRWRRLQAKSGELRMGYGREPFDQPDMCYAWGPGSSKGDAVLLHMFIVDKQPDPRAERPFSNMLPSLLEELAARGYDLTTFKLSVRKKVDDPPRIPS